MNLKLTERNKKYRGKLIDTEPIICTERAVIWTEVFSKNEAEVPIKKAALALAETLDRMTIFINEEDLIVGNQGNGLRASTLNPIVNTWAADELDRFEERDGSRFRIEEKAKEKIREYTEYWKGRNVFDTTMSLLSEETKEAMDALVFTCGYTLSKGCGHWLVNFENVLRTGFYGLEKKVEEKLKNCDYTSATGIDEIPLYQSLIITCQAVKRFAERYAVLAEEMVKKTEGRRKEELERIAQICRKVPYYAPETFYEAIQTIYFIQLIIHIESDGTGISLGRLDDLLYPFYKKDLEEGRITKEEAEELVDQLWLKIASIIQVWNEEDSKSFGGHPISQAITLGGMDEKGNDATNELSYMMLETTARVHMAQPSVCCRINRNTPEEFLLLCSEVIREGIGMPAMYNDEIAIPSLVSRGIPIDIARKYYAVIGCVEMGIQGKLNAFANSGYFNLAKALELYLHNGKDPATGKVLAALQKDVCTAKDYAEFEKGYLDCVNTLLAHQVRVSNVVDTLHSRIAPLPFVTVITDNCIEQGKEVQSGGACFNYDGIQGVGLADVTDSMMVIKKKIFEEKCWSLEELIKMLDSDFVENEAERRSLLKGISRYGNNDRETNAMARKITSEFCHMVESYQNTRGGFFIPGMYSNSANVPLGAVVGALPNGRKAGMPIAEACSPSHEAEKEGPTQAALSVAALDHMIMTNGSQYNQKYHPSALKGSYGIRALSDLIRTFFEAGGYHIQFNVVSGETLKAAQKEPEKYKDLVVRVAGYTAFFVDLNKDIQNDIISRTEMEFGQ
ncbi:MAG: formate C-acetyltransferase/glycerol dehydratase family glycyl radical enzyme [Schaedlerella sp.]|nr:formate C-acetyltransferase/glycerol dehydratase family glycyl radical enzyme [Schaedlerella sp.]